MTPRPSQEEDPEGYNDLLGDNDRRAASGGPRQKESDITARVHHVTLFKNKTLTKGSVKAMTLPDIQALVHRKDVVGDTKNDLPLLKLAKFKNNARNDDNMLTITGIEIDYDGMVVSFDDAVAKTRTMDVRALVYTSPRHEADKPKWRILMPTSTELPPEMRVKLVARVIGFFGIKFDPASYTLSQSFYYGAIRTNESPDPRTELIDGRMVDLCDELEAFEAAGAKDTKAEAPKDDKKKKKQEQARQEDDYPRAFKDHLKLLGDGPGLNGFNAPLCEAVAAYVRRNGPDFDREVLKAKLRQAIDEAPRGPERTDKEIEKYLSDAWLDGQIIGAIKKFGDSDDDIKRLNESNAVLPIGGKTKVVTFGEDRKFPGRTTIIMTRTIGDFASLQDKYRHEYKYYDKKKELQSASVPLGSFWIKSPDRRQYDGGMEFMPWSDEKVVGNKLNLWHGFGVQPIKPAKKSGAAGCQKFLDFMFEVMCSKNEMHFDFLRKREATIIQKRKRTEAGLIWRTKGEGAGKGFYERVMGPRLLGNHAMQVTNPDHVIGKFNPHLEVLLRLTADEALFAGNHSHRNAMYSLVTESNLTIEHKFAGVYQADNFLNMSVTSNEDHVVQVGATGRRYFMPTVSEDHLQDHAYFKEILDQLVNNYGLQALLYHLAHEVDLTGFNIRAIPRTAELLGQKLASLNLEQGWWLDTLMRGELPFGTGECGQCPCFRLFEKYIEHASRKGERKRSIETILGMFLRKHVPGLIRREGKFKSWTGSEMTMVEGYIYEFPPLEKCREAFANTLQQPLDWDASARWGNQWVQEQIPDPPTQKPGGLR